MIAYYPQIQLVHVAAVLISGTLFLMRGLWLFAGREDWARAPALRYLAWTNDSILLTAALMLMTTLNQYPFVQSWLTVKVLLLVVYIVLGILALHGDRPRSTRIALFVAALAVYGYIISVARAHHPSGFLVWLQA